MSLWQRLQKVSRAEARLGTLINTSLTCVCGRACGCASGWVCMCVWPISGADNRSKSSTGRSKGSYNGQPSVVSALSSPALFLFLFSDEFNCNIKCVSSQPPGRFTPLFLLLLLPSSARAKDSIPAELCVITTSQQHRQHELVKVKSGQYELIGK